MLPPLDRGQDGLPYAVDGLEHIRMGDPKHFEAIRFEDMRPFPVATEFRLRPMRRPVDFHDQLGAEADEIDDVAFDRVLAPELPAVQAIAPQCEP